MPAAENDRRKQNRKVRFLLLLPDKEGLKGFSASVQGTVGYCVSEEFSKILVNR
jgi:hypothetical protein